MGWWTTVNGDINFYKETWQNKEDAEDRIADNLKDIETVKIEMAMLAAGNVQDLIQTKDEEGNDVNLTMALRWKLEDLWDRMENAIYENWKLEFLLENWDNRRGDFIDNPKLQDNTPYIAPMQSDDINDRQLKLEFDDSIEETPEIETPDISRGLGSLSDHVPNRFV